MMSYRCASVLHIYYSDQSFISFINMFYTFPTLKFELKKTKIHVIVYEIEHDNLFKVFENFMLIMNVKKK